MRSPWGTQRKTRIPSLDGRAARVSGIFFGIVIGLVLPGLAAPARAGGANDTKVELLGWAPDGTALVQRSVSSLAGGDAEVEVVNVGRSSHTEDTLCAGSCSGQGLQRALTRGRLVPGGSGPSGVSARVRRVGRALDYELEIGGAWHRVGRSEVPSGTIAYAFTHQDTQWSPTHHVVAFKVFTRINWGVENEDDTKEHYHLFALPEALARRAGVKGLESDVGTWQGRRITVTASSTLYEGTPLRYRPRNLLGGDLPWCEGAKGAGYGTTITYAFARPVRISGFRVKPGFHQSVKAWRGNNRVMLLQIRPEGGAPQTALFQDERRRFTVPLAGGPRAVRSVTFTLKAVYPGTSPTTHDTCVSELVPF